MAGKMAKKKADDDSWKGQVRRMENKNISLPFSIEVTLKKLEHFEAVKSTIDAKMDMLMRIKFAGLDKETSKEHMAEVIEHCYENKLNVRINEEEDLLLKHGKRDFCRSGTVTKIKSSEWKEEDKHDDMIEFKM